MTGTSASQQWNPRLQTGTPGSVVASGAPTATTSLEFATYASAARTWSTATPTAPTNARNTYNQTIIDSDGVITTAITNTSSQAIEVARFIPGTGWGAWTEFNGVGKTGTSTNARLVGTRMGKLLLVWQQWDSFPQSGSQHSYSSVFTPNTGTPTIGDGTWSTPVQVPETAAGSDFPVLGMNATGNAVLARMSGTDTVVVPFDGSNDTWGTAATVITLSVGTPVVAVNNDGTALVASSRTTSVVNSDDLQASFWDGTSWSNAASITSAPATRFYLYAAVASRPGEFLVAYIGRDASNDNSPYVRRYRAATWESAVNLDPTGGDAGRIALAADASTGIALASWNPLARVRAGILDPATGTWSKANVATVDTVNTLTAYVDPGTSTYLAGWIEQSPTPVAFKVAALAAAPDAPTGATATAGDGSATVSWTAPANNGGSTITSYAVTTVEDPSRTCTTTATAPATAATTCTVNGLTNGTSYTFTVTATTAVGTSSASAASAPITPAASGGGGGGGGGSSNTSTSTADTTTPVAPTDTALALRPPIASNVRVTPSNDLTTLDVPVKCRPRVAAIIVSCTTRLYATRAALQEPAGMDISAVRTASTRVLIGTATRTTLGSSSLRMRIELNARGRAGLRRVLALPTTLDATAIASTGARATVTSRSTLRLPTYVVLPTDGIFATGAWQPTSSGTRFITRLRALLPPRLASVTCTGYTDDRGAATDNLWLGAKRAATVCTTLRTRGLHAPRWQTLTAGESNPRATNATAAGRELNRRVAIRIAYLTA